MICIRCKSGMEKENFHNVLIDRCPKCGGVWLDRNELEKILINRKSIVEKNLWYDIKTEIYIEKRFPMIGDCQKCGGDIVEYEKDGLVLERCISCKGVFFDKKEFDYILSLSAFTGKLKRSIKIIVKSVLQWLTKPKKQKRL